MLVSNQQRSCLRISFYFLCSGLNSLLLIRHAVHRAKTTVELVDIVADAGRGCSWLYPACDATGDCVSVESGIHRTDSFDPLMYVEKWHALRVLLPSDAFIAEHSSESSYRKGMYVRRANYSYPLEYLSFNSDLFRLADVPYDPSVWGVGEKVFSRITLFYDEFFRRSLKWII